MGERLKHLRDKCSTMLKPLFLVLVRAPVRIGIWKTDQMFLMSLNNPIVGSPSVFGSLIAFQVFLGRAIKAMWKEARIEYSLQLYKNRNLAHYAKNGRGYINLENLSNQECVDQFAKLESRLQVFSDAYPMTVGYKDGESFLDAGCGKGQNLKFIFSRYPNSPYIGFDFDERCLQVARVGVEGSSRRSLIQGSILDVDFLRSFEDKSIDHICICGVFSTLLESSIQQIQRSHQKIVDEFVRISRKSIMIIDEMSLDNVVDVKIEQLTRATVFENIASYFVKHQSSGEACTLAYNNFRAVLFKSVKV